LEFVRPDIIRPPSEHDSYFLPLTSGCSNSTCTFCGAYGSKLRVRQGDDVKKEIDAMVSYMRHRVQLPDMPRIIYAVMQGWNQRRVFLQDGDALVYPFAKLKEVIEYLNDKFPTLERIGCYATPQDILRKSLDELKALKELKLGILYMGIESGDDKALRRVNKGVDHDQLVEAGRKAKAAGITLSVTVILGLGGVEGSRDHVLETARVLTEIDPDYAGALTLTLIPGLPLCQEWKQGKFSMVTPFDFLGELKDIIENSEFTNCFFSSMHASNYYSVRGKLSQDKARMIRELEHILARRDTNLLRPEGLRGL
jgi:radical SAM superfamily enzyme YgiQ (UPF0313 family)